jgi:thiol-disulfide isomerase/thioredoxin
MFRFAAVAPLAVLAAVALAAPAGAAPAKAPKVSIASFTQLQTPLPYPYDEKADADAKAADAKVAAAKARAKASGKLLIIDLGGNWCGDCRILQATMDLPEMKTFLDRNFEMVSIDVGHMDKNLQIPARYGVTSKLEGVPAIFVVDPKSGQQLVSKAQIADLADARHMHPQDLANWLAKYTK